MAKTINLKDTVYKLSQDHPDFVDIMVELGFKDIVKPSALASLGRFMTLTKGSVMRGIAMKEIEEAFENAGFEIIREE